MNRKTLQQLAIVNNLSARKKINRINQNNEVMNLNQETSITSLKFINTVILVLRYGQRFLSLF